MGAAPPRNPTTGTAGCCARAASGHAAAPPSSVMNSRRLSSGRDADFIARPPAQNRTCGFPAYGSHLGCVTAKRTLGQGWRMIGFGSQAFTSCVICAHVIRSFWLRRLSVCRRIVRAAPRPKSVRESEEVFLVDRVQQRDHRPLDDLVLKGRDRERALPTTRLGDVNPP